MPSTEELEGLWARHNAEWRDSAQITSQWEDATDVDPRLLVFDVYGDWWKVIAEANITLLVTREYEHLVMAMRVEDGKPNITYMRLPHPSGIAVDPLSGIVHIALTRNPNQIYDFAPLEGVLPRLDIEVGTGYDRPLMPLRSRFLPGCFYIHDLAVINGDLYANSVGQNAVVRLYEDGRSERVWWPLCIEQLQGDKFGQNRIQLNSIAASATLQSSYFSASSDELTALRPGHPDYPVDKRGVIFSGSTREPIARGLTRPHSARLHGEQIWVDNSGYGEVGVVADGGFTPVVRLPGWTRGLCFHEGIAFAGTSRVIPRFRQYAPGLDVEQSTCGVHAIDTATGAILGGLTWHYGNQIFAVGAVSSSFTSGFPFPVGETLSEERTKILFYTFAVHPTEGNYDES